MLFLMLGTIKIARSVFFVSFVYDIPCGDDPIHLKKLIFLFYFIANPK